MKYLWVNLNDLSYPELTLSPFGSILNLMILPKLGDELLPGSYYHHDSFDKTFIVIACQDETRPKAIAEALELIGKKKIGRKIRTRITARLPQPKTWRYAQAHKQGVECGVQNPT